MRTYFPGANTGHGFVSRFEGILPPAEPPHYTFVLKGGPGVGKNTLMARVAKAAEAAGEAVEYFPCASDPDSLDAVRLPARKVILLDGTAPHTIDPVLPGIADEVIDLGHFRDTREFAKKREQVCHLLAENRAHYTRAYAALGAAARLKQSALEAAASVTDMEAIREMLYDRLGAGTRGKSRGLFARSATPVGVLDFTASYGSALRFAGAVGEVALLEAERLYRDRGAEIGYDFLCGARAVKLGGRAIALSEDGDLLTEFLSVPLPEHVAFCKAQVARLTEYAVGELQKCLAAHDAVEATYRPFVDYARVNREGDDLMRRLELA